MRDEQHWYRQLDGNPQHKTYVSTTPLPGVLDTIHQVESGHHIHLFTASPEEVVRREELDLLVILYSHILLHNLMPNLTVEILFTTELLVLETSVSQEESNR